MTLTTSELLEVLALTEQELNTATRPIEAAVLTVEAAFEALDWDAAFVVWYHEEDDSADTIYLADTIDGHRGAISPNANRKVSQMTRRVLAEGALRILRTEEELAAGAGTQLFGSGKFCASLIYAPMKIGDKTIGLVSAQSYALNKYSADDLMLLQVLANACAGTLRRIELAQPPGGPGEAEPGSAGSEKQP